MRIPGLKIAKKLSRWVQARLFGGAMILGYHRVASVQSDEYEVCVSPGHFAEQMETLSRYAHPIALSQLVTHLNNGSVPDRSIAVTFDDGYLDNLQQAKPILEKYAIPATIFVCSGYTGREFWWDELERLIVSSTSLADELRLQGRGSPFKWEPPMMSPEAGASHETIRRELRRALYHYLLHLKVEEQSQAMDVIRQWSRQDFHAASSRAMTPDELIQIQASDLIELGSHTRNHPMLPNLSLEQQREEIMQGKRDLETLLGKSVSAFAYPNGRATDDAKRIVKDIGFSYACTSLHDMVRPSTDRYELTRFWQQDVDGEAFLRNLNSWMTLKGSHA